MLNVDGATAKSGEQVDLRLEEQVVLLALETGVRLLLDLEHHVSGHDAGHLVTLATELDLVSVLDTLVDVDVEDLALDNGLLSDAALAAVLLTDDLTLSTAVGADSLEALDHGTHLAHHRLHTGTATAGTRLDGALLTTAAIASRANDRLLQSQLRNLAAVDILQVDLVHVVDGASLLGALVAHATAEHVSETAAAATEELGKEILGAHATTGTAALKTLLTILVVDATLLGVGQDLVGVGQFLELLGGLRVVAVLVFARAFLLAWKSFKNVRPGF